MVRLEHAVCGFTFVILFGRIPIFEHTLVGQLHRFLLRTLPRAARHTDAVLTNGRISRLSSRAFNRLVNEASPIVVILYCLLVGGGVCIFYAYGKDLLDEITAASTLHKWAIPLAILWPFAMLLICCRSDPGVISTRNHAEAIRRYPYDSVIFHNTPQPAECSTCRFAKPARSKHCSLCGVCVEKADHHCIWINNCIGRNNERYFMLFIISTAVLLIYDAPLLSRLRKRPEIGGLFLMCCVSSLIVIGFFGIQIYQICSGATTNESSKWQALQWLIAQGDVFQIDGPYGERLLITEHDGPERQRILRAFPHARPISHIKDVHNIYDLGPWANLVNIIYAR